MQKLYRSVAHLLATRPAAYFIGRSGVWYTADSVRAAERRRYPHEHARVTAKLYTCLILGDANVSDILHVVLSRAVTLVVSLTTASQKHGFVRVV